MIIIMIKKWYMKVCNIMNNVNNDNMKWYNIK